MRLLLPLVFLSLAAACHVGAVPDPVGQTTKTPSVSVDDLRSAPGSVTVDGRSLSLSASLWRDCMPSMPPTPDCHPMTGIFAVSAGDGGAFPAGARVDRAWVIFGDEVWEVTDLQEQDAADPSFTDAKGTSRNRPGSPTFRVVARNGPRWGPGVSVDVVVRLTDARARQFLLRAPKQVVARIA